MISVSLADLFQYAPVQRAPMPTPAEGAADFASLLDAASRRNAEAAEADPFSALGVFGRYHATAANDVPDVEAAPQLPDGWIDQVTPRLSASDRTFSAVGHPAATMEARPTPWPQPARWGAAPRDSAGGSRITGSGAEAEVPPQVAEPDQSDMSASADAEPDSPTHSAARTLPDRPTRPSSSAYLTLMGPDLALQILARVFEDSPEALARLRHLIEQTTAEFGMSVGELHLNGSAAESSSQKTVGDFNGSRAR